MGKKKKQIRLDDPSAVLFYLAFCGRTVDLYGGSFICRAQRGPRSGLGI